jgi:hypothetical protein
MGETAGVPYRFLWRDYHWYIYGKKQVVARFFDTVDPARG